MQVTHFSRECIKQGTESNFCIQEPEAEQHWVIMNVTHPQVPQPSLWGKCYTAALHSLYAGVKCPPSCSAFNAEKWTCRSTHFLPCPITLPRFTQLPAAALLALRQEEEAQPGAALAPLSPAVCLWHCSSLHSQRLRWHLPGCFSTTLPPTDTKHKQLNVPVYIGCLWSSS